MRKLIGLMLLCLMLVGCFPRRPLDIALSVALEGPYAEVGMDIRKGVLLAVENLNEVGGVNGRQIAITLIDDQTLETTTWTNDQTFYKSGIQYLIGHDLLDEMAIDSHVYDHQQVIVISPILAIEALSAKDDAYFTLVKKNVDQGIRLAQYAKNTDLVKRLLVIYHSEQDQFAQGIITGVQEVYGSNGTQVYAYDLLNETLMADLLVTMGSYDGVLLVVSPEDLAMIVQHMALGQASLTHKPIYSSSWGTSESVIASGGKAAEQIVFFSFANMGSLEASFNSFSQAYQTRYKENPSPAAMNGYESVLLIAQAMVFAQTDDPVLIKEVILNQTFQGIEAMYSFDGFGDVERDSFLLMIQQGRFTQIEE